MSFGLQSALAIRRQRIQNELMRAMERRRSSGGQSSGGQSSSESSGYRSSWSTVSGSSGLVRSVASSTARRSRRSSSAAAGETECKFGVFDCGIVLVALGVLLMIAGVSFGGRWPVDDPKYWNGQLFLSGLCLFGIGFILVVIGQLCNRRDGDELAAYVNRQMAKTNQNNNNNNNNNNWSAAANMVAELENGLVYSRLLENDRQRTTERTPPPRNVRKPSMPQISEEDLMLLGEQAVGEQPPVAYDPRKKRGSLFLPLRSHQEETQV